MRLRIALLVLSIAMVVIGIRDIVEALKFQHLQVMTYDEFARVKPQEGWFRIKDGLVVVVDATWIEGEKSHTIEKVFVPLLSAHEQSDEKAAQEKSSLILETEDPDIKATVSDLSKQPEAEQAQYAKQNATKMVFVKEVEGILESGTSINSESRKAIDQSHDGVANDYVVLKEGHRPSMGEGFGLLIGGGILVALQLLLYIGRRGSRMTA